MKDACVAGVRRSVAQWCVDELLVGTLLLRKQIPRGNVGNRDVQHRIVALLFVLLLLQVVAMVGQFQHA